MFQIQANLTICNRCILPNTFPGIKFDDHGICNYCRREEKAAKKTFAKKAVYQERLDNLINDIKGKASSYDAILAFSGGKDSSYTLKLLKTRYALRLLTLTFDNHFISAAAWDNISTITDAFEIDLIRFRPPWQITKKLFSLTSKEDIFSKPTLLRASTICTSCIGIVKSLVLKTALEMSIPLVAFGWSPGQAPIQSAILKTNSAMIHQNQLAMKKAFPSEISQAMNQYFIPDSYYEKYKDCFPQNIHPLAFFDYNEESIKKDLIDIGWKAPEDTDTNSSNCLLNAFANYCHIERHGFHPYVWEIANMVRQNIINRDEGIQKIYTEQNRKMVEYARERLGV